MDPTYPWIIQQKIERPKIVFKEPEILKQSLHFEFKTPINQREYKVLIECFKKMVRQNTKYLLYVLRKWSSVITHGNFF